MAAPGRSDVNIVNVWPGRRRGTDQPVSTLVSTSWIDPAGYLARFAQSVTHDLHASAVRDPAVVRSQVRTAGTHSGVDTGSVRTGGSRYRFAAPYARTFRANLGGLPVEKC